MPNPYAGTIGYNTAIDDAIRIAATVIDAEAKGDVAAIEFGVKIISAITALRRVPRHRRTKAAVGDARRSGVPR